MFEDNPQLQESHRHATSLHYEGLREKEVTTSISLLLEALSIYQGVLDLWGPTGQVLVELADKYLSIEALEEAGKYAREAQGYINGPGFYEWRKRAKQIESLSKGDPTTRTTRRVLRRLQGYGIESAHPTERPGEIAIQASELEQIIRDRRMFPSNS